MGQAGTPAVVMGTGNKDEDGIVPFVLLVFFVFGSVCAIF
jgi:hypothetical protein